MITADDLFKSITGFEEIDVNMLEGVHTTYNSLSSRFEIAPDDNRNISYPFEYCWQNSSKIKNKPMGSDEDDEFSEMWEHSIQDKLLDGAANFGNELPVTVNKHDSLKNVNEILPDKEDIGCSGVDKKS